MLDHRLRRAEVADALGQVGHRHFLHVPDIDHLSDRLRLDNQFQQGGDDVGDVCKGARLFAVPEHGDRFAGQRLADEVRDHHSVLTGLTRSDGVEEADDDDGQLALLPVSEREELVDRLAARVGPAVLRRRPEHEIGIFAERHVVALAVHLGGRGEHHELFFLVCVLQHHLGAVHVGLDGIHRLLDDQLDADRGGEVEDDVASIDQLGEQSLVVDRVDEVLEPGPPLEMRDVVDRTGRQVVEDQDLVALREQGVGEVGADKPGSAGDQGTHATQSFRQESKVFTASAIASTSSSCIAAWSGSESISWHTCDATG